MPLSHLDSYTAAEWKNLGIDAFAKPPRKTPVDNPDPNVVIEPAGWVGTHLFAFKMTTLKSHDADVQIDNAATEQMDVDVTPSQAPQDFITYWTVETEAGNGKDDDWSVTYDVKKEKKQTGKWVFTKSKDDDDPKKDRKGCLGMFLAILP